MSKDESNKNMCAYCRHRYFGCMTDGIRCYGICGSFIKDSEADMSDCYWTKHKVIYIVVKSILYYLPILILVALFVGVMLALFLPYVFIAILAVLAIIAVYIAVCLFFYLVVRFVKRSFDDVE